MVSKVVECARPARVILYGSHARALADHHSDVDLLVLFDRLGDRREMVKRIYEALIDSPLPKDIVIATVGEFERFRRVRNTLFWTIGHSGRVVHESTG